MDIHTRPYKNEHSARIKDPKLFNKFRRKNNEFGEGIHVIYGRYKGKKKWTVQAIRFDSEKFTIKQAKAWLKKHGYKYILFESAIKDEKLKRFFGNLVKTRRPYTDTLGEENYGNHK